MDDLHRISNVNFSLNGNDLIANAGKIRAIVNNSCDIKTLHEMFVVQLYNFQLPGDLVFIDVGMNIGLASLFFHSMHEGYSYGFELIPDTFAAAEANLDLNVKVSMKHTSYPFGLLNCDSEFTLAVNPDDTVGNSLFHRAQQSDCQSDVAVRVKDAAVAVEEIYSKHPDSTFVLKLDAEGSEYEILDRLFEKDLLSRISLLLLELHPRDDRNPESIRSQLRSTNFCWNESIVPSNGCGLLYAYHRAGKGWLKSKSNGKAATCEN
ncbi:MAG TPA: FkbM family methyltransferase [Fimbriimonadaceae bacterium]|nr:FkbM family methyltransferase [Fimbriimonadaceae bacterium]